MRRLFRTGRPIIKSVGCGSGRGRGKRRDGGLSGQRIHPQRGDGLSAAGVYGPPGRAAPAAGTVSPCVVAGRRLRIGRVSPGAFLPGPDAGEGRGRGAAGPGGFRRGGEAGAADTAVFCPLLCHGRVRTGAGASLRRRAHGRRHLLYGCGCPGAAYCGSGCLFRHDGGVPGSGQAWRGRAPPEGAGVSGGAGGDHDGPPRHGERAAASRLRGTSAGDSQRCFGWCSAAPGAADFDTGAAALPGGSAGASALSGAGVAVLPGTLPDSGTAGGPFADGAQRLDRGGGDAVPGIAGWDLRRRRGRGLCRFVGRQRKSGRAT